VRELEAILGLSTVLLGFRAAGWAVPRPERMDVMPTTRPAFGQSSDTGTSSEARNYVNDCQRQFASAPARKLITRTGEWTWCSLCECPRQGSLIRSQEPSQRDLSGGSRDQTDRPPDAGSAASQMHGGLTPTRAAWCLAGPGRPADLNDKTWQAADRRVPAGASWVLALDKTIGGAPEGWLRAHLQATMVCRCARTMRHSGPASANGLVQQAKPKRHRLVLAESAACQVLSFRSTRTSRADEAPGALVGVKPPCDLRRGGPGVGGRSVVVTAAIQTGLSWRPALGSYQHLCLGHSHKLHKSTRPFGVIGFAPVPRRTGADSLSRSFDFATSSQYRTIVRMPSRVGH